MLSFTKPIPLSLYIHFPWCISKCPYCDFNSHALRQELPEQIYIDTLICDLEADLPKIWNRSIGSIFMGGGTPSLFSPDAIEKLLLAIKSRLRLIPHAEITLEANPGTVEQQRFQRFREAGINRLSIGVQSFQDDKLKKLGRIHDSSGAIRAIEAIHTAGFNNFNIDLMYGLPEQTAEDALFDLATAISLKPKHLSWYQLTLEPNTLFFQHPPQLPDDDYIWMIQEQGQNYLIENNFQQYEISAYCQPGFESQHNLNYWQFGDYLGIGAGAHSKITDVNAGKITRLVKAKNPKDYLNPAKVFIVEEKIIQETELPLEFMMNTLRVNQKISKELFAERTGLNFDIINSQLKRAASQKFLKYDNENICVTQQGKHYLNNLLEIFLQ